MNNRKIGSLVGLAVGDAVGTTVEFKKRGSFPLVTDLVGGGPFRLPAGYWTDDTSLALCLAESLIEYPHLNKNDLLDRFTNWYKHGYNSSTGKCFDIGLTTCNALEEYAYSGSVYNNDEDYAAGNGSIMRLAPVTVYATDLGVAKWLAREQSSTTHAAKFAVECCELLANLLMNAYTAETKEAVLAVSVDPKWESSVKKILLAANKEEKQISSSGFSVHTLEAALWSFLKTDNFRDCILTAVNLGDDADTVGAVAGQIAGAFYGIDGIPEEWLEKLYQKEYIIELAEKLIENDKA